MNCLECQKWLQDLLDGDESIAGHAHVQAHLHACAACRELFGAAEVLGQALRIRPFPLPPPNFADKVVTRLLWDRRKRARSYQWYGLAASLAAVGLLLWSAYGLRRPEPGAPTVVVQPTPSGAGQPETKPLSFRAQLDEARDATLNLTKQLAQDTVVQVRGLVPRAPEQPSAMGWDPAALPVREVGRTVANGLEPVAGPARRAWGMLLDALPVAEDERSGL
jgi:hypothetical protein